MTLIVETGTGNPDAQSYASVADADAYVADFHESTEWANASEPRKERALRRATRFVDANRFVGVRGWEDQALNWPRALVGYVDGQEIFSDQIPLAIREATMEAALKDVEGDDLLPDHDGGTVKSESSTVGPIQTSTQYAAPKTAGKRFEAVRALLKPYLSSRRLERSIG